MGQYIYIYIYIKNRYLFIKIYRVAAIVTRDGQLFNEKYNVYILLAFRNNFEEIRNTESWILLKQLDYTFSISLKR